MSIRIPSPNISLNSDDWDIRNYRMDVTMEVAEKADMGKVFDDAAKECKKLKDSSKSGSLTLIINCHGYYEKGSKTGGSGLAIGAGLFLTNAKLFTKFAPTVDKIIITACGAAAITHPGADQGDGNLMCGAFAKYAKAKVQASQSTQTARLFVREDPGYIDDWEGVVLTYGPDGSVLEVERHA